MIYVNCARINISFMLLLFFLYTDINFSFFFPLKIRADEARLPTPLAHLGDLQLQRGQHLGHSHLRWQQSLAGYAKRIQSALGRRTQRDRNHALPEESSIRKLQPNRRLRSFTPTHQLLHLPEHRERVSPSVQHAQRTTSPQHRTMRQSAQPSRSAESAKR